MAGVAVRVFGWASTRFLLQKEPDPFFAVVGGETSGPPESEQLDAFIDFIRNYFAGFLEQVRQSVIPIKLSFFSGVL